MKESVVIINNEKCMEINKQVYCENIEMKSIPEALSRFFDINLILRKGIINPVHKVEVIKTSLSSNIISFTFSILKKFGNKNAKFLIIAITPYTFIAYLLLAIGNKKIFLYLRSDGLEEYKLILGKNFIWIYRFMLFLMCKRSTIFCVNNKIITGHNYKLVLPSQLDNSWFENIQDSNLKEIKLLYVGRIKIEKGIFSLLNLLGKINLNLTHSLTLVGHGKKISNLPNNVNLLSPVSKPSELIKIYDNHNITILPSFTEGHPQVLIESLARRRPIIIFNEIDFVKKNYQGVFVSKRNADYLAKTIKYIIENYHTISELMKKNVLPSKAMFIKELAKQLANGF